MTDDENRRLEELWTRFVAREPLGTDERAALAAALERDEVFRRRMVHDLQLDGALRAAGEIERGQERIVATVKALVTAAGQTEEVVAAVRKRIEAKAAARMAAVPQAPSRRARPSRVIAAAFLLAGGAAALLLLRPRLDPGPETSPTMARRDPAGGPRTRGEETRPPARGPAAAGAGTRGRVAVAHLAGIEGRAYLHGADGTLRTAREVQLSAGDWVSTSGAGGRARLNGPGGSRVELAGDAVAGLATDGARSDGARVFLAHGRATAVVPPMPGGPALILASPHAVVTAAGTVRLDVGTALTRVEVTEGRARVSALGVQRGTDVSAGQFALVRADDLQPPRAQTAPREALLLTGPDGTKEEPPPPGGLRGSEERLKARLERLGFQVNVADAGALSPERAREATLLVFSSSVSSKQLGPAFAELPVPMLVLESTGFEQLGLTGRRWGRDVGSAPPQTEIVIENPAHPLAGGLTGTVRVLAPAVNLRWAAPLPSASVIATYPGAPDHAWLLFGYERGATTATGIAPARRVGMFLGNGRVIRALTDQGWRLFDAAVLWATGG